MLVSVRCQQLLRRYLEDGSRDHVVGMGAGLGIGMMRMTDRRRLARVVDGDHPPGVAGQRVGSTLELAAEIGGLHGLVPQRSIAKKQFGRGWLGHAVMPVGSGSAGVERRR